MTKDQSELKSPEVSKAKGLKIERKQIKIFVW